MNPSIRQTQKKYGSMSLIVAIFIGMAFILMGYKALAKGLILGTLFSVFNFVLMGELLPMTIGKTRRKSTFISLGSVGIRYGLLAVPLIAALRMEALNFTAAVIGIFMVQLMILGDLAAGRLLSRHIKRI